MLPPNVIGSLNNLTRAGIIDPMTASYAADTRYPMYSGFGVTQCPCDTFEASTSPFGNTPYERHTFWSNFVRIGAVLGMLYLGGKGFLYLAKGAKGLSPKKLFSKGSKSLEETEKKVSKGWKRFFKRAKSSAEEAVETVKTTTAEKASFFKTLKDRIAEKFSSSSSSSSKYTKRVFKFFKFRPSK